MGDSFEKINYSLRPAKSIERKMLCETFHRLSEFGLVNTYRYIGFGSTYFTDFRMVHKTLGISTLISIERAGGKRERFDFNKPYNCIQMEYGESNDILPSLEWDSIRTILWLDYDGMLTSSVLTDIKHFCSKACPGSLLIASVNSQPETYDSDEEGDYRLDKLRERVGNEKVPATIREKNLSKWGLANVSCKIILNEIKETLKERNGGRAKGAKLQYHQLFNFHYADNAKMLTTGGLIYDEGQQGNISKGAFDTLEFVRSDEASYLIEVPILTFKELRHLDAQLPKDSDELPKCGGVPEKHLKRYRAVYRYFPTFTETEM